MQWADSLGDSASRIREPDRPFHLSKRGLLAHFSTCAFAGFQLRSLVAEIQSGPRCSKRLPGISPGSLPRFHSSGNSASQPARVLAVGVPGCGALSLQACPGAIIIWRPPPMVTCGLGLIGSEPGAIIIWRPPPPNGRIYDLQRISLKQERVVAI